jgi:hypothetical protein
VQKIAKIEANMVFECFCFFGMRNEDICGLRNVVKIQHRILGYVRYVNILPP